MKQHEAKDFIPLLEAWRDGKTLQFKDGLTHKREWSDVRCDESLDLTCHPHSYRIKPEPKLRPWRPEEVPVGALLTNGVAKQDGSSWLILAAEVGRVMINGRAIPLTELSIYWSHSLDRGKTWLPCGVAE